MKPKIRRIALGTATLASTALLPGAQVAANPFVIQPLASGYQLAQTTPPAQTKAAEGKCGEGKCGAGMMDAAPKADAAAKRKDANCGAEHKKQHDGKCGAVKKKPAAKATEGKCGEGKCGAGMSDGKKT